MSEFKDKEGSPSNLKSAESVTDRFRDLAESKCRTEIIQGCKVVTCADILELCDSIDKESANYEN